MNMPSNSIQLYFLRLRNEENDKYQEYMKKMKNI